MSVLFGAIKQQDPFCPSLYTVFEELISKSDAADKIALVTNNGVVTYKDLDNMVNSLCEWLLNHLNRIVYDKEKHSPDSIPKNDLNTECHSTVKDLNVDNVITPTSLPKEKFSCYPDYIQRHCCPSKATNDCGIVVCLERGTEHVAIILAIWKLHMSYIPLDQQLPHFRSRHILQHSNPHLVLGDDHTIKGLKELVCQNLMNSDDDVIGRSQYSDGHDDEIKSPKSPHTNSTTMENLLKTFVNLEEWKLSFYQSLSTKGGSNSYAKDIFPRLSQINCNCSIFVALIMYTSGSSGVPKAIKMTSRNILNRLNWLREAYPFEKNEHGLWIKPTTFIDSINELICPLLSGIPVILVRESIVTPELAMRYITNFNIKRFSFVPSFLYLLLRYIQTSSHLATLLKEVNLWISSGEPLPKELVHDFYTLFPKSKLVNLYGSTEVTGDVTHYELHHDIDDIMCSIPLGSPIYNTAILIVKDDGDDGTLTVADEGEAGEIIIIGETVCEPYNLDDLSENKNDFLPLSSLCFRSKRDIALLLQNLEHMQYVESDQYNIIENSYPQSIKQTLLKQRQLKQAKTTIRSCSLERNIDNIRAKRSSSICSLSRYKSASPEIVADEIELLSKFKSFRSNSVACDSIYSGSKQSNYETELSTFSLRRSDSPLRTSNSDIRASPEIPSIGLPCAEPRTSQRADNSRWKMGSSFDSLVLKSLISKVSTTSLLFVPPFKKSSTMSSSAHPQNPNSVHQPITDHAEVFIRLKPVSSRINERLFCRTGDFGRIDHGCLNFEGRRDSQVNIRGTRISLCEVEHVLRKSGQIRQTHLLILPARPLPTKLHEINLVSVERRTGSDRKKREEQIASQTLKPISTGDAGTEAIPSKHGLKQLVAFVVLKDAKDNEDTESLVLYLRRCLPETSVPQIVIMDKLPTLPSGKVDGDSLIESYIKKANHVGQEKIIYMKKEESIETRVLRLICEVLGMPTNLELLKKNFFMVGGTSINSVEVVVHLREAGFELTLETFLKAPTIAHVINDILKAKTRAEVVTLFSPCPSPRRNFPFPPRFPTEGGQEIELDETEEEDTRNELGWIQTITTCSQSPAMHLLTTRSDFSPAFIDAAVRPRASHQSNLLHSKAVQLHGRLKLSQLWSTPLPKEGPEKENTIDLIAESYVSRNPLDLVLGNEKNSHRKLLQAIWPILLQQEMSFVVRDSCRGIIGVMVTTDLREELQVDIPTPLAPILALQGILINQARQDLLRAHSNELQWANNRILATHSSLEPQDNVRLALHLERELLKLAATKGCAGIFTINSNPMNQLLCSHFLGYETKNSIPIHSFEYGGGAPFKRVDKDLSFISMTKKLK